MSDRRTKEWTPTAEEAFGPMGKKGLDGELFMMDVFNSWGWYATHHEDDKEKQIQGIDISFQNPKWANEYTCDVKNNMDEKGNIRIEKKWFQGKKALKCDRIFHVNPNTGWIVYYGVPDMAESYDYTKDYMILPAWERKKNYSFMSVARMKNKNAG